MPVEYPFGSFPNSRPRRMRRTEALRRLCRETCFSLDQLAMPYFVREGHGIQEPIDSMPEQFRFSIDRLLIELEELTALGIRAILLFGIPEASQKDGQATQAWAQDGIVPRAVSAIKQRFPDLLVITDVCLCAYTHHGHCGVLNERGEISNDETLSMLAHVALAHAKAGADIVAPSDMMDGRVAALRRVLDDHDFKDLPILSYAAKYASAFYGPFRDAAHSAPQPYAGPGMPAAPDDRLSYQMDPCSREEALREIALDIQEGADMVMVKPALAYLDILREAATTFHFPLAAYAVSGEYSMIQLAARHGLLDEKRVVLEVLTSLVRAGARTVISYHAKKIAAWHRESQIVILQGLTTS